MGPVFTGGPSDRQLPGPLDIGIDLRSVPNDFCNDDNILYSNGDRKLRSVQDDEEQVEIYHT